MSETNEPELLPCPFCGGKAHLEDVRFDIADIYEHDYVWIRCTDCSGRTSRFWNVDRIEDSVKCWNRRKTNAPQWTTELPKEEGWYMILCEGKHVACIYVATGKGKYDSYRLGMYEDPAYIGDSEYRFVSIEDYASRYDVTGWCKVDFPTLPRKEATK